MNELNLEVLHNMDDVLERHMEEEDRRFAELQHEIQEMRQDIKDAWQYADEFRSDNPLVLQLGNALGKTEAEIKAVFELANTL